MNPVTPAQTPRSTFVSALAWSVIVPAVFMIVAALLQVLIASVVQPADLTLALGADAERIPPMFRFMFAHLQAIAWGFFLFSVATLASAIGLLMRKPWGWWSMIALLVLSIGLNFASLMLESSTLSSMQTLAADLPPELQAGVAQIGTAVSVLTKLLVVAFSVLFAWFIYRLTRPAIRAEFRG